MPTDPTTPRSSDASIDWEAIARYLAGESSAAESALLQRWLEEHKADAEVVAALDNAMAGLALRAVDATAGIDVEGALARVAAQRDAVSAVEPMPPRRMTRGGRGSSRTVSPWRPVAILAAAAAVIVAARLVLHRSTSDGVSNPPLAGAAGHRYASAVGKRDSVRLPDGSRVILGPASQLVVGANYGQRVREVELHGEAYFDVVHDTTRPFVVRAGAATIRDVGTSFAVRSDSGTLVQVVVTSGSVALSAGVATDSAILAAGDVGTVQSDGRVATEHAASTAAYLAWMRDSLVFREAPLSQVSNDLRRWYGVTLRVEDSSLMRQHLTGSFSSDPLERVLRVIGLELGADVERRGDTAIVRSSTRRVRPQ